MATTRVTLLPEAAHFPTTSPAALSMSAYQNRPVIAFDSGATEEECYWTWIAPQGMSGTLTLVISLYCLATSGTTAWNAYIEAYTSGDTVDLDANSTPSWDSTNDSSADTVPGTAGYFYQQTITLTNKDSVAAGDYCRLRLVRDTSVDTAAADACVLALEIREA